MLHQMISEAFSVYRIHYLKKSQIFGLDQNIPFDIQLKYPSEVLFKIKINLKKYINNLIMYKL